MLLPRVVRRSILRLLFVAVETGRDTRRAELATTIASSSELSSVAEVEASLALRLPLLLLVLALLDGCALRALGTLLEDPSAAAVQPVSVHVQNQLILISLAYCWTSRLDWGVLEE